MSNHSRVVSSEGEAPLMPCSEENCTGVRGHESAELPTQMTAVSDALEGETPFLPVLEIVEQPRQRGFRFRYPCEGASHGGLPGENSVRNSKSFPTVLLRNHAGRAKVVVSLVTGDDPVKPHAHRLVGKTVRNGICTVDIGPECDFRASINLGILHATKKNVSNNLLQRLCLTAMGLAYSTKTVPVNHSYSSWRALPQSEDLMESEILESQSEDVLAALGGVVRGMAVNMNLSTVRLCFQAYLEGPDGMFEQPLLPVISQPVFDSKAPSSASLKICRMDRCSGKVSGGDEVFLLCEKIQKDDIEIVFYNSLSKEATEVTWSALGTFSSSDVHRQTSVVFRTPAYDAAAVTSPIEVWVALRRKSDGELSEPVPFTYQPFVTDPEGIANKKRKLVPHFSKDTYSKPSTPLPKRTCDRMADTHTVQEAPYDGVLAVQHG